ncbi:MAG: carboxylase [Bacteroidetes bacterium GWE2_29_8]|nr:MAG: carboxylase [Bacteroidetes bacterium GWE2_29_8]OFY24575.1 MAG: carboxylase [Bacteroidetes bacterium GWF2_29_10]
MNQAQVDKVLNLYKDAGFYALEVWGGAIPDSVMRYLNEDPWDRLEKIKAIIGDNSKLTALSRGRNLFGYNPYTYKVIEGFNRNAIQSGISIMRIFDALNDLNNLASTIKIVKENGAIADCAVCYTVDPKVSLMDKMKAISHGKKPFKSVFNNDYFVLKATQIEKMGADMISIKDMAGLIPPKQTAELIRRLKKNIKVPIDFHTHCTPGYGLASSLTAIINGVDIVDTCIWNFAGGSAAPAYELIYIFCKKLGIEIDGDVNVISQINKELLDIRKGLEQFDETKMLPIEFDISNYNLPKNIDKLFDDAIKYAKKENDEKLLEACNKIDKYFNFPPADINVKDAEIPGGMYSNMLAQLKQLKLEQYLPEVLKLVPAVRIDAGCPPLVTPTSQIVGVQAVNCIIDKSKGLPYYTNNTVQFVNLVKGLYGKTPIEVDPDFREQIAGTKIETPFDEDSYQKQANPNLDEFDGVKLSQNEKEELLLELFPAVAVNFLKKRREKEYIAKVTKQKEEESRLDRERIEKNKEAIDSYQKLSLDEKAKRLYDGFSSRN